MNDKMDKWDVTIHLELLLECRNINQKRFEDRVNVIDGQECNLDWLGRSTEKGGVENQP